MGDAKPSLANACATRAGTRLIVALQDAPLVAILVIRTRKRLPAVRCAICFRTALAMGGAVGERENAFVIPAGAAPPAIKQKSVPPAIHVGRTLLRPIVPRNATCLQLAMGMDGAVEGLPFAPVTTAGGE